MALTSKLEETFAFQCRAFQLPIPTREYRFDKVRLWRFDFAWPLQRLAVEIEGGIWNRGRHMRGSGYEKDCEKYNAAVMQGWRVLRFTDKAIKSGEAVEMAKAALN